MLDNAVVQSGLLRLGENSRKIYAAVKIVIEHAAQRVQVHANVREMAGGDGSKRSVACTAPGQSADYKRACALQ